MHSSRSQFSAWWQAARFHFVPSSFLPAVLALLYTSVAFTVFFPVRFFAPAGGLP
ncbi:MAG: hypothetical protein NTZ78_13480 [Candidatus Aureabacteria bacterium]|nr:hypothetical protein [Candidatus Auribacterota bacterium]